MSIFQIVESADWPQVRDTLPEVDFLWGEIIPMNAKTLCHAAPGNGKSAWLWGLLHAIQQGLPYLGLNTRKSKCLLISNDMNIYEFKQRWDHNFEPSFPFVCIPKMDITSKQFVNSIWFTGIRDYVQANDVDVIGIDAIGGLHAGRSAGDDDVATMVDAILSAWLPGKAFVLLGHDKKTLYGPGGVPLEPHDEDFLGSQIWRAMVACQLHMWKLANHKSNLRHAKSQVSVLHPDDFKLYINLTGMAELWDEKRAASVVQKFNEAVEKLGLGQLLPTEQVRTVAAHFSVSERTAWRWYSLAHP